MKTLSVNSVTLFDESQGKYVQYFGGHQFEDDDPALSKIAPSHFVHVEEVSEGTPEYYEDLKVPELLEICRERNLQPESNKKFDLIAAITADDEKV